MQLKDRIKMNFKSKLDFCPCHKPVERFIIYVDINGNEENRKRIGEPPPVFCEYCGKLWSEHN